MNTSELGVYILGATALAILAAAGIAVPGAGGAILAAILASGAAYVSQFAGAVGEAYREVGEAQPRVWSAINAAGLTISVGSWLYGIVTIMGAL